MLRKLRSVSTLHKNTSEFLILCRYDKKLLQYKSPINTLDLRLYSLSSNVPSFDVAIVGCGLVGLSTAMHLKERLPSLSMVAIDKEPYVAAHQSTNNSGVIHAGIYYKPGSLRAKLCVEGMLMLYEYCEKYNIPYKKNGKLIVAVTPQEVKWMENLLKIGNENKVPGLEIYDLKQIQEIEPYCVGIKALWSPWTGIIEFGAVARHFASRFRDLGGRIVLNYPVTGFVSTAEGCGTTKKDTSTYPVTIFSKDRMLKAGFVMTACGLQADRVAQMTGEGPMPKIVPFRGEYFKLSKEKENRVTTNIYPVPDPSLPFIGVHFTPRLDGTILLGPTAMIAYKREGYKWNEVDMGDCLDLLKFKGIYIFATKYFKSCLYEVARSVSKKVMLKELQLYMPTLTINDLTPGAWAGVQAQAMNNDGSFTPDFNFSRVKGRIFHCRNTPSPGATSSIALGKHLAEKIQKELQ